MGIAAPTGPSNAQMIAEMARAAERRLGNYNVQHLASTAWALAKVFCRAVVYCLYGGSILPSYGAVSLSMRWELNLKMVELFLDVFYFSLV